MLRKETMAFGGDVLSLSEKVKGLVRMIDKSSCTFVDDATAQSKAVKAELDRCGFHYWTFET